jgi:ribonuclease III
MKEILGYRFNNPLLLQEALTHPSVTTKKKKSLAKYNYERLEFLGDAALSLVIIDSLIKQFPEESEGDLAKRKSGLVSGEILAQISHSINIGNMMEMTESEANSGGRENSNNLENALEAVIGAIYLDAGLDKLKELMKDIWQPYIDNMHEIPIDSKSLLQEKLQRIGKALPKYELIDVEGPGHMLIFQVRLQVPGFVEVMGKGRSKQQAEKEAATLLLEQMND